MWWNYEFSCIPTNIDLGFNKKWSKLQIKYFLSSTIQSVRKIYSNIVFQTKCQPTNVGTVVTFHTISIWILLSFFQVLEMSLWIQPNLLEIFNFHWSKIAPAMYLQKNLKMYENHNFSHENALLRYLFFVGYAKFMQFWTVIAYQNIFFCTSTSSDPVSIGHFCQIS